MSNGITGKGKRWELARTWWLLLLTGFFLGWIAFLVMGFKAKQNKWKIEAIIYCAILNFTAFFGSNFEPETLGNSILTVLFATGWIVSIVRFFMVRKEYLLRTLIEI